MKNYRPGAFGCGLAPATMQALRLADRVRALAFKVDVMGLKNPALLGQLARAQKRAGVALSAYANDKPPSGGLLCSAPQVDSVAPCPSHSVETRRATADAAATLERAFWLHAQASSLASVWAADDDQLFETQVLQDEIAGS